MEDAWTIEVDECVTGFGFMYWRENASVCNHTKSISLVVRGSEKYSNALILPKATAKETGMQMLMDGECN